MREITQIIIHCSATKPNQDIGVKEIDSWHKKLGWAEIGYHLVIKRSGEVELGRDFEKPGAHCKGHNQNSIGICLVGGISDNGASENNFTKKQFQALAGTLTELKKHYPHIKTIVGHNKYAAKDCPCFDVQRFLSEYAPELCRSQE